MTNIYLAITKINPEYYVKYVSSNITNIDDISDTSYTLISDITSSDISSTRPFILKYENGKDASGIENGSPILYFKFLRKDGAPIDTNNQTNIIEYFLTYDSKYDNDINGLAEISDNTNINNDGVASGLLAYGSYNIQYQITNTPVESITASTLVSNFVKVTWETPTIQTYTGYRVDFTLNNETLDSVASFTVSKNITELIAILPSFNSYRVTVITIYDGTEASLLSDTIIYTGIASVISLKDLLEYQEEINIRDILKNNGNTTPLKTIGGNTLIAHSDLVRFNTIENATEAIRSSAINTPNIPITYKSYSDYNMARIGRNQRRFAL